MRPGDGGGGKSNEMPPSSSSISMRSILSSCLRRLCTWRALVALVAEAVDEGHRRADLLLLVLVGGA